MGGCIGSCLGSCLAADCIFLATLGDAKSRKAVRCTLTWLQVFAAVLSMLVTRDPVAWTTYTCVPFISGSGTDDAIGICACGQDATCLSEQLVFRVQASAFLVYALQIIMAVSGCSREAAHRYPLLKFMAVVVLAGILLVIPNSSLGLFNDVASVVSAIFLVVQLLLLFDLMWQLNDHWVRQMNDSLRAPRGGKGWQAALLSTSAAFFIGALVGAWELHQAFGDSGASVLIFSSLLLSVVLLVLSITEWCKEGNLLTSCVVCSYAMWLCWLALQARPGGADADSVSRSGCTEAVALAIAALCIGSFTDGAHADGTKSEPMLPTVQAAAGANGVITIVSQPFTEEQKNDFIKQCAIHASGTLFVASIMAPQTTWLNFCVRVAAVLLSLMVYGWALVAPQVMSDRF